MTGVPRPTVALARALGVTRGQASTLVITFGLAVVLAVGGLPPVLRHRPVPARDALPFGRASDEAAGPSTAGPTTTAAINAPITGPTTGPIGEQSPLPSFTPGAPSAGDDSGRESPTLPTMPSPPAGSAALFTRVGPPGAPHGIVAGGDGAVYVATNNGTAQGEAGPSRIFSFGPDGTPGRTLTVTGQPAAHAVGVTGLALDGRGGIVAADAATDRILHIDLGTGVQSTLGTLPDVPSCPLLPVLFDACEPGLEDNEPDPRDVAFDERRGQFYVTDAAQGIVWRLPSTGGNPTVWLSGYQFTSGDGMAGIAVDADGDALVTVPVSSDPATAFGGALYRVPVDGEGAAGVPELAAGFPSGDEPAGLVALLDGSTVVVLRGADAVVLLGPEAREERRVQGAAGGAVPLDAPTDVAWVGSTALVTNHAPDSPSRWAVLAVGLR